MLRDFLEKGDDIVRVRAHFTEYVAFTLVRRACNAYLFRHLGRKRTPSSYELDVELHAAAYKVLPMYVCRGCHVPKKDHVTSVFECQRYLHSRIHVVSGMVLETRTLDGKWEKAIGQEKLQDKPQDKCLDKPQDKCLDKPQDKPQDKSLDATLDERLNKGTSDKTEPTPETTQTFTYWNEESSYPRACKTCEKQFFGTRLQRRCGPCKKHTKRLGKRKRYQTKIQEEMEAKTQSAATLPTLPTATLPQNTEESRLESGSETETDVDADRARTARNE